MDRITQALQRAREEREQFAPAAATAPAGATPETITYRQTRTVDVPTARLRERRVVSAFEPGAFVDSYKIAHTHVLQRLREHGWNTLAVTSPGDREGKTLTAINLAVSLAQEVNHTVMLVDADLRHPSVHTFFDIPAKRGLSDYLLGEAVLPDLLVHPAGIDHFVILPGGRPLANSAEMLGSPRMARLVDEIKRRYASRIIVFDLPPLLSSADALAFAPYVEAALLVVEEAATPADEVRRAAELLQKTTLIGTVLNKSRRGPRISTEPRSRPWRAAQVWRRPFDRMRTLAARLRKRR